MRGNSLVEDLHREHRNGEWYERKPVAENRITTGTGSRMNPNPLTFRSRYRDVSGGPAALGAPSSHDPQH